MILQNMNVPFVDLQAQYQSIQIDIDRSIASVIKNSAYIGSTGNSFINEFENGFARWTGAEYCISCANGTDSLEILLKAYGIGLGDEVIVPALSWISTSESVSSAGATPVFVDVNPTSYT